jgi:chemotaxis protein MotA
MDIASLIGLLIACGSLVGAFLLEGGKMGTLLVTAASMIVFGGTIGVTIISFTLDEIKRVPHFIKVVFNNKQVDYNDILELLVYSADKARREGFLSLESQLDTIENKFLARGLQLVIDGTDPELTKNIMEMEIDAFEKHEQVGYEMFMTAGGFAPTMGIIGTVMGMVHVLGNLSNPDDLGGSIAVAFLATLYGISSANILWIPFANKIKLRTNSEIFLMEMILEGVLSIQNAENPRVLRDKLRIYLPSETRQELTALESEKMGM